MSDVVESSSVKSGGIVISTTGVDDDGEGGVMTIWSKDYKTVKWRLGLNLTVE